MYALESRVTRSINGRAAHFDIPKWRDPLQPQLPYRISAQAAAYAPWPSRAILPQRIRRQVVGSAALAGGQTSQLVPEDRWGM